MTTVKRRKETVVAEREREQAGGETAAIAQHGIGGDEAGTGGERGASIDEDTARRRERRGDPAPPSDHVIREPADNPTFGGAAGTSIGGAADDPPPDPYGT